MLTFNFANTYIILDDPVNNFIWSPGHTYIFNVTVSYITNGNNYDAEMVQGENTINGNHPVFYNNNESNLTGLENSVLFNEANWLLLDSNDPDFGYPSENYFTPVGSGGGIFSPDEVFWYKWEVKIDIPAELSLGTYYFKLAEYDGDLEDWTEWDFLEIIIEDEYTDYGLISGETNSDLSFIANRTDTGFYKCKVYNIVGEIGSDPIALTVQYLEIIAQSGNIIISVGQLASFSVTVIGVPSPEYQWYKNDEELSGEISSTLSFYCSYADAGSYKCKIHNVVDEIYSDEVILTVVPNKYRYNLFDFQIDLGRGI